MRPRNHFATLRGAFRSSLGCGASRYLTFVIFGPPPAPDCTAKGAWDSLSSIARGWGRCQEPRKACETIFLMTLRPRNHFVTLRIAFGRSLRPGASRYLTFAIFGDFELSAVPWQRPGTSIPPWGRCESAAWGRRGSKIIFLAPQEPREAAGSPGGVTG